MRGKASLASRPLCVVFLLLFSRTAAAAGVIYVDADAPGANNGSSWENAYVFLQDALTDAETAERPVEIRVAKGIYKPDQGANQTLGDRGATFQLINNVTLKGGYAGFGEPDPNARDIEAYETILSGDLSGNDIDINDPCDLHGAPNRYDNSKVVVTGSNTDTTAVLDGFTISGGRWDEPMGCVIPPRPVRIVNGGAGMNNSAGSPTVIRCTFTFNTTNWHGACMHNAEGSNPTVIDCTFIMNFAEGGGAAMMNRTGCNPNMADCKFSANLTWHNGGAMYNLGNSPTLTNCTFSRNLATRQSLYGSSTEGGGMYNRKSSPVLNNCTFSENSADIGGAIYNRDSNTTLNNCEFVLNTDSSYGGAVLNSGGQLVANGCIFKKNHPRAINDHNKNGPTFTDCIFNGNSSYLDGGAAHVTSATFNHCIFSGNMALRYYSNDGVWYRSSGGAVYSILTSTFNNCTFNNNWADYGCALYCYMAYVKNCIFWGSEDQIRPDSPDEEIVFVEYSNIQGGSPRPGKGNIDTDPCFVDPGYWADADDPNIVAEPNDPNAVWVDGDYHLKSQTGRWDPVSKSWVFDDVTSPCIDAGDPNSPVAFEPFPNGGIINMGAYGGTVEASMSPSGIHAKYGGGAGEPNDPYLIYTPEHMNTIGTEPNDWDKHFKLMADIDLSKYTGTDFNIIGYWRDWDDYKPFIGIFDGNGHTISNFNYDCNEANEIGLFGNVGYPDRKRNPQIRDLGLINPNVDIKTGRNVGSLVGHLRHGNITGCYAEGGCISGTGRVGGIVGRIWWGTITNCHSSVNVMGGGSLAGLVGYNYGGTVEECFTNGNVIGNYSHIGGLVAWNNHYGEIVNCYATGDVSGDEYVGGLVGRNQRRETRPGRIRNCYSVGRVTGTAHVGGLVGSNWGTVELSFWDMETSGQSSSAGGTGLTTTEMQTASIFLQASWDFVDETANDTEDIWWILEGQDYPRLWWELINEK